jgi:hypothetical protein
LNAAGQKTGGLYEKAIGYTSDADYADDYPGNFSGGWTIPSYR